MSVTEALLYRSGVRGTPHAGMALPLSRNDLAGLTKKLGFTRGAEVGVWKGEFSARLLEGNPDLHLLCVDPWEPYQAWKDTKNALSGPAAEAFMANAYTAAVERLRPLKATICRQFSAAAAETVEDASLDFVYIDANHGYDAVLQDLTVWTPKVRPGGFISGHDYREQPAKPFIQVVSAVRHWTSSKAIAPWFVLTADRSPSFLWEVC